MPNDPPSSHRAQGATEPAFEETQEAVHSPAAGLGEAIGDRLGPYRILQLLGQGGFGSVYLAEQEHPVRRRVALKVIKLGMDTRQVVARFEAERQALALMDHPNVAKVFDAGSTPAGRPYFVMELVRGVPITEFCDQRRLTIAQRLDLFLQVCQAVQHAHQKGIIHRDIKPSNVLVGSEDDRPRARVIDFGIAKATQSRLTDSTLFTDTRHFVGTPEYMSPEQADGSLDIDTRSDVYSLGALLYELLAGSPPFNARDLRSKAISEIQRVIREVDPALPSTRISTSADLAALSERRGITPRKLRAAIRGELDWIVLRAMEKDRARRYQSAAALAADVSHFLAGEPVQAGPPSAWYRLRKFTGRHRVTVTAAALLLIVLAAGIAGTTWQAIRANRQRDDEIAARKLTVAALRTLTDDVVERQMARRPALTPEDRQFLLRILAHYESFSAIRGDTPECRDLRAEGHFRVGKLRLRLGELAEARSTFDTALAQYEALSAEFPASADYLAAVAACHNNLGIVHQSLGQWTEAEAQGRLALDLFERLSRQFPADPQHRKALAMAHNNLGMLRSRAGDFPAAEAAHRQALTMRSDLVQAEPAVGGHRFDLAASHIALGTVYSARGDRARAESAYQQAVAICAGLVTQFPTVPDYRHLQAQAHNNLLVLYESQSLAPQARAQADAAINIHRSLVADFPGVPEYRRQLAMSHNNLANFLSGITRLDDALRQFNNAGAIFERLVQEYPAVPDYRAQLAAIDNNVGNVLKDGQQYAEAERHYRRSLESRQKLVEQSPDTPGYQLVLAQTHFNLGLLLDLLDRPAEAAPQHQRALSILLAMPAAQHGGAEYRQTLGRLYTQQALQKEHQQEWAEALTLHRQALDVRQKLADEFSNTPWYIIELAGSRCNVGHLIARLESVEASLPWYDSGIRALAPLVQSRREPGQFTAREYLRNLNFGRADALMKLRKFAEAVPAWEQAIALDDGRNRSRWGLLATMCLAHVDPARAVAVAEQAIRDNAPGDVHYNAACVYAQASAGTSDSAQRETYARRAVELLRQAIAAESAGDLAHDPDLDPLRDRDDFKQLTTRPAESQ